MVVLHACAVRGTQSFALASSAGDEPSPPIRKVMRAKRRCKVCHAYLAADNIERDGLCSPCRQARQRAPKAAPDYSARADPEFVNKVATLLIANYGKQVHLGAHIDASVWEIHDAVQELRTHWGFVIEAKKGRPGYTMVAWSKPQRKPKSATPATKGTCS